MESKFVILCTLICALFISGCSKKDIRNERLQNGLYVKSAYYDFGKIDKSKNVRANFEFELANRNKLDISCFPNTLFCEKSNCRETSSGCGWVWVSECDGLCGGI